MMLGCAGSTHSESVCQLAADHLAACDGDDPAPEEPSCDQELAQFILETDCENIGAGLNDVKADASGFRRWACKIGLYRYCDQPACVPDFDESEFSPVETPPGSACLEGALKYQGCGACSYYSCREETAQCGQDGYLIRYAERYCMRYRLVSEPHASAAGRRWLRDVRRCLIETLDQTAPGDDCDTLTTNGLASHAPCYLENGFCDLPIRDWLLVLNTVDRQDSALRHGLVVGIGCLKQWLGG